MWRSKTNLYYTMAEIIYNNVNMNKWLVPGLIAIIIGLAVAVAYLAGRQNLAPGALPLTSPTPTPAPTAVSPSPSPLPSPSTKTVSGGGVLSFPRYEITVPLDWTVAREIPDANSEKLTVSSDQLAVSILEGGFGGAVCLFPGDPDSEGPSGRYANFKDITTQSGDKLRRVWDDPAKGFGLCQLTQYGWGTPIIYGHVSLKTPPNPSAADLNTIDAILSSFKRR